MMIGLVIVRAVVMSMMIVMRVVRVVMRMIAMMVVGAAMIMMMVMPVVVAMIVMMIMLARVAMCRTGISATFRVERPFDGDDFRAEAARHVLDHTIAPDAQRASGQFDRQVTIAKMPGDASQRDRVLASYLGKRLRRGDHFDDAPIFERQAVAGAQHQSLRQIEQKGEATDARHRHAPAMPVVVVEHDAISGRAGPRAGGANGAGSEHWARSNC